MPEEHEIGVTALLRRVQRGDRGAIDQLMPLVDGELHRLARIYMSRERPGHMLQPTILVDEAYLKLVGKEDFRDRAHFYALAAKIMKEILVDEARRSRAVKRGRDTISVALDELSVAVWENPDDIIDVHEAHGELAKLDERQARIIELRLYGGLTCDETAEVMGISSSTVDRESKMAFRWLRNRLSKVRH